MSSEVRVRIKRNQTHSVLMGYLLWIFGFLGAHRFYFGRPLTGLLWFMTGGLFLIGWIIDLFLIPSMDRDAEIRYMDGPVDYNVAWVCLSFFGVFGIHRFYMGKWITGLLYLFSVGLFGVGIVYDFVSLNGQVDELNRDSL